MLYTIWFLGSLLHVGCTKDNYIDTGISNGRYHGNLMQYMASNSYDWDSTILLVRHAGEEMVRRFSVSRIIRFVGICWNSVTNGCLTLIRSGVVKCCWDMWSTGNSIGRTFLTENRQLTEAREREAATWLPWQVRKYGCLSWSSRRMEW